MTTKQYNDMRAQSWADKLTEDDARLFIIIGARGNGICTYVADGDLGQIKIAEQLEILARSIRGRISKAN